MSAKRIWVGCGLSFLVSCGPSFHQLGKDPESNQNQRRSVEECNRIDFERRTNSDGFTNQRRKEPQFTSRLTENTPPIYLPFPAGKAYRISQGYGGTYSHNSRYGYYALDFAMNECSPVLAVTSGRVIEIKKDSNQGGPDVSYASDANYIHIDHGHGAYGVYLHLCQGCVFVEPGDLVARGDLIGLSGNTGWSTQPHLHFQMNSFVTMSSYRKSFEDIRINQGIPIEGKMYASANQPNEGSIENYLNNESPIGKRAFADHDITLTKSFHWYKGLRRDQPTLIRGYVSRNDRKFVTAFLMSSDGSYVDGVETVVRANGDFELVFQPDGTKVSDDTYRFVLATRSNQKEKLYVSRSVYVFVGK